LKPKGKFIFIEHVVAEGGIRRAIQVAINPVWHSVSGCNTNRDTAAAILNEKFQHVDIEPFDHTGGPWLVRPHIRGIAVAN
jgi:hypothetical protein